VMGFSRLSLPNSLTLPMTMQLRHYLSCKIMDRNKTGCL